MLEKSSTEYGKVEILLNNVNNKIYEMNDKFDKMCLETETENIEIERQLLSR